MVFRQIDICRACRRFPAVGGGYAMNRGVAAECLKTVPNNTSMPNDALAETGKNAPGSTFWDFLKIEMGFVKEFACSPFLVGSICPSSPVLAGQLAGMAQQAALKASQAAADGLILDLGAGPGPVTAELLNIGVSPDRIVAVERSSAFAAAFKRRYRQVPILTGDAANLRQMLAEHFPDKPVCAIISSLPFRSIPRKIASAILWELHATLREHGGVLVQYSYLWWMKHALREHGFKPLLSRLVFQNVPPARVESYIAEPEFRPRLML